METEIVNKEEIELEVITNSVDDLAVRLRRLVIVTKNDFDDAAIDLEIIAMQKNAVKSYWEPLVKVAFDSKKKATEALREVRDKEDECMKPLDKMDEHVRKLRLQFKLEQDMKDKMARKKAEEEAQAQAKAEADELLTKAEKSFEPAQEERLIEKAAEVRVAPIFTPKTIKKSERTESGTLNTFVDVVEVEVHDIKSICGMVFREELPVNVISVSEPKIKAWAKSFDKPAGMYDGFNISKTQKERITARKK
ncbi:MAG: hypothetical protein GY928_25920 [Colwellia sp.]|nr:hypothetical protein [Colwellia sp.]